MEYSEIEIENLKKISYDKGWTKGWCYGLIVGSIINFLMLTLAIYIMFIR